MKSPFRKDIQYYKFCLYGFLKNQKFYEPFFLLFLLSKDITYLQAGLLYSIKELTINLLEIPAGIIADSGGRRRSMLLSFIFYICSFALFFLASGYALLVLAIIIFAFGDVFRTGTHKAMIFDYLERNGWSAYKVQYYGNTRSWSQTGSALSALLAALIVILFNNYTAIFAFAIIPYMLNFINLLSYPGYLDGSTEKLKIKDFKQKLKDSVRSIIINLKQLSRIKLFLNSSLISGSFNASKDYLQPLILSMVVVFGSVKGLGIEDSSSLLVGLVYSFIFLLNSLASRMSGKAAKFLGNEIKGLNYTYLGFTIFLLGAALCFYLNFLYLALALYILVYSIENLRRPMAVSAISSNSNKEHLATCLSVDSQLKSLVTMVLSPIIGFFADRLSPGSGLMIPVVILLALYSLVRLKK
ncbi:MAG: MFS transporter [Bacteroidales bacterium]|nr:MFS transporter [Bacteroidales bacterium]